MGLTVGPYSVYKKKVALQEVQMKKVQDTVITQKLEEEGKLQVSSKVRWLKSKWFDFMYTLSYRNITLMQLMYKGYDMFVNIW